MPLLPEHDGRRGPADVDVEQAHVVPPRGEPVRQLRRERALAHAQGWLAFLFPFLVSDGLRGPLDLYFFFTGCHD